MFDRLASLAQGHGKRTAIFAVIFFVAAGAIGGGVASKLAPYGADDPATESVKAQDRLEADGFREPSVIVLLQDVDPNSSAGQTRIAELESRLNDDPDVASVTSYVDTHSPDFVSKEGDATYLAVALKPTDDKERQDAAKAIADDLDDQPGVTVGGISLAQEQVNKQVEKDLRMAEMIAFPLLFLLSLLFFRSGVAALLPLMIGGLAIVGTFLLLRST
jgi:putative drug exporter of the RND superfamily